MLEFSQYLENIPNIHTWDAGKTWNDGGFNRTHFEALHEFFRRDLPARPRIIETGAGNSTLFFLQHAPARLVTIDPMPEIHERIAAFCETHGVDRAPLDRRAEASDRALPKLAEQEPAGFDFGLIDGDHGWPIVMVDFCYMLALVKKGGFLMIDDINVYAIKELVRQIERQPGFSLALDLGKARVYRKDFAESSLPGWWAQPYIVERTERDVAEGRAYAID